MTAREKWEAEVKARGGAVVRLPVGVRYAGELGARYVVPKSPEHPNGLRYEAAPFNVRAADALANAKDEAFKALGKVVDVRDAVVEATGVKDGALGVAANVLGVPRWLMLAVALFVGYSMLVQAKLVPPLSRLR